MNPLLRPRSSTVLMPHTSQPARCLQALRTQTTNTAKHRLQPSPQLISRRWKSNTTRSTPKTALFFPGQGVQRIGMATPWLAAFPRTCAPFLALTDSILSLPLSRTIAQGPNSALTATGMAQPAIMATSVMILRVLEEEFNFRTADRITITLGHSLGEFAALVAGGYLEYADALRMVSQRAQVMARCSREARERDPAGSEYGMYALVCEPERLAGLTAAIQEFLHQGGSKDDSHGQAAPPIERVSIANVNSKNQIVLSGSIERIQALLVQLRQFGGHDPRAVRLLTDSPFHSPVMRPAEELMRGFLLEGGGGVEVRWPGVFPCVSNVSARPFRSREDLRDLLARQATETVRWWDSIKYVDQEVGVRRWIGIGPGKVGRNLVGKEVGMRGRDNVRGGGVWGLSDPKEVEEVLRGLEETEGLGGVEMRPD